MVNFGKSRRGLGSSETKDESRLESNALIQDRVLKVGNKRKNDNNDDDDMEDLVREQESDDEEELGRTALAGSDSRKIKDVIPNVTTTTEVVKNEKKKKLGKKEREKLKAVDDKPEVTETPLENVDANLESTAHETTNDMHDIEATHEDKPFRRPKKRSRQKNIVRDKRTVKPAHLQQNGVPLTPETRKKLNLPPSITSQQQMSNNWDGKEARPNSNRDSKRKKAKETASSTSRKTEEPSFDSSTKYKKKKSKYKNLG